MTCACNCTSGERKSRLANKSSDDTSEHRIKIMLIKGIKMIRVFSFIQVEVRD